ncbi:MAG TPA: hypothetical protein PKA61_06460 [Nitrospira sp.]|nr:hypothetical protein [Nitrospira sp.]
MNLEHTLHHLREAGEELQRIIGHLEDKPKYGYGEFAVAMQHLYHHLNTAWNARGESPERIAKYSEVDFIWWRQFPDDIYLGA